MKRLVLVPCLALVCVGCAASEFVTYKTNPDYPRNEDTALALPGLAAPVSVTYDPSGVPHVKATSQKDLVRAVGYVQARDRLFQMDLLRRIAAGRVSELVGEEPFLDGTTVSFDLAMRGWGLSDLAGEDVRKQDDETRDLMEAYADGVNAAMAQFRPLEYRLLKLEPEPWSVEDSYAIGRLIGFSVTHNWHQEASRLLLALHVGIERADRIYPSEPMPTGRSLDTPGPDHPLPLSVVPEIESLFPPRPFHGAVESEVDPNRLPGTLSGASNAWVVGPDRSVSGKPVLANDPHLTHMVPSLMFQQHISDGERDVIGITAPGIPFVFAGHNDHVAWGMTSTVADTVDLCIERVNPDDGDQVLGPGGHWLPIQKRTVVIRVRHKKELLERHFTVRGTRNGPAFNDLYPGFLPRWAPLVTLRRDKGSVADSILGLTRLAGSSSVAQFMEATKDLSSPVQTWTVADVDGMVGVFASGRVPIRRNHRGTFPIPGWLGKYDWAGIIPHDQLPRGTGTGDALFAHGNNLMSDPGRERFLMQVDSGPAYRYDRIMELLNERPKHDMDSLAAMQKDVYLGRAARLVGHMLQDLEDGPDFGPVHRRARDLLQTWDFKATSDSAAAALFFVTYREAAMGALVDELDPRGFAFLLAQRYSTNVADGWMEEPDHPVWDHRGTSRTEKRAQVMRPAFLRAVEILAAKLGTDPDQWRWGQLHELGFIHPFGGKKALSKYVNMPRAEGSGGLDSVWKSHFDLGHPVHPFTAMAGPVWRMVVDLADIRHGWWISDTGTSGWPGSPHYKDQHELWKQGEYVPMVSDWDDIRKTAVGTLVLQPE